MRCRICQTPATPAFTARVLNKHDVTYRRCPACGFMQTEEPFWLGEAYASAINSIDLGPVNRAITGGRLVEGIILSSFDKDAQFVDYGGGYGVFVRYMRDNGFDFYWQDQYCENLFAKHFVAQPGATFELLTAFEVFEHLVDPLQEIETMLTFSSNILFSTLLVPGPVTAAADWWYFGPDHGQHVAFFTVPALQHVARRFGLHLCSNGRDMHLLSKKPVSPRMFRFFAEDSRKAKLARRLLRRRMRRQSLLMDDFRMVSGYTV